MRVCLGFLVGFLDVSLSVTGLSRGVGVPAEQRCRAQAGRWRAAVPCGTAAAALGAAPEWGRCSAALPASTPLCLD